MRNPHGYSITTDRDGKTVERDTMRCVHCGAHFAVRPGSGARRFYCFPCGGITCGAELCDAHIPFQAQLDHMEGKATPYDHLISDKEFRQWQIQQSKR